MYIYKELYVASGSSISLALLVWEGGGLLRRVVHSCDNEPSLGKVFLFLQIPPVTSITKITS